MAAKKRFIRRFDGSGLLNDRDWLTIISALRSNKSKASQALAKKLLTRTKPGRHIRLLRLIYRRRPTFKAMERMLKVSRRTIYRDLNDLEGYGIKLQFDAQYRYEIIHIPESIKKLL